jgi:hypothetical protein
MKSSLITIILFFLLAITSPAQTIISGTVTDVSNIPVPFASVYLSKTTVGAITDMKGIYTLTIPQEGKYELIASCLGYKTLSQIITAEGNPQTINIKLENYDIILSEVIVKAKDVNRPKNYKLFLKCFIGNTSNARLCTIENPKDVIIYRDYKANILNAFSVKPLIIINKALGYTINYELTGLHLNLKTEQFKFSGYHYFQQLEGNQAIKTRWQHNRSQAYYGSRMHFLRALYNKTVTQENFEMHNSEIDSLSKAWYQTNLIDENEVYVGYNPGCVILYHRDPIGIIYNNFKPTLTSFGRTWATLKNYSAIIFSDSLQVYKNGYTPNTYGVTWGGTMAMDRIAEMLPYDFIPQFTQYGKKDVKKESPDR